MIVKMKINKTNGNNIWDSLKKIPPTIKEGQTLTPVDLEGKSFLAEVEVERSIDTAMREYDAPYIAWNICLIKAELQEKRIILIITPICISPRSSMSVLKKEKKEIIVKNAPFDMWVVKDWNKEELKHFEKRKFVFWGVDIQNDFMNKDGALPIPNAESIKPMIKEIIQYAKDKKLEVFGSMDWHDGNEPEMAKNGGLFPLHCMENTKGAELIPEISQNIAEKRDILPSIQRFVKKQDFDVFSKKEQMDYLCKLFKGYTIVVCGVATDYCVKLAVLGFLSRGFEVIVIEDAIMGVHPEKIKIAIDEMNKAKFMKFIELKEVIG